MKNRRFFKIVQFIYLVLNLIFLSACSPINSVQPFDEKQAELILKNDYTTKAAQEKIEIALPNAEDWKKINVVKNKKNIMFVPVNENSDHWTQSIRTQSIAYLDEPKITAKKMVLNEIKEAYEHCKQVKAMVIKQTPSFVTYKLDLAYCDDSPNQIQIGKAFNGSDAVYTVFYSALVEHIPSTELQQMSQTIKRAQLVSAS